jgi:hypothetical protein
VRKKIVDRASDLERIVTRQSIQIPVVLALPRALGPDLRAAVVAELDAKLDPQFRARLTLVDYGPADLEEARGSAGDEHQAWLLFIDSAGVLRVTSSLYAGLRADGALGRWVEVFRNR